MMTVSEYERAACILTTHLASMEITHTSVTEDDLIIWYTTKQMEIGKITEESDLLNQQQLARLIIERLINVDHLVRVVSDSSDPTQPGLRELQRHYCERPHVVREQEIAEAYQS